VRSGLVRLLRSLPPEEGHAAGRVLRRCPRIALTARSEVGALDLPPSKVLLVDEGVALLVAIRRRARRPAVLTLAGAGAVLAPPVGDERLCGLTEATVLAVPPTEYAQLLRLPEFASALVEGLVDALHERQQSLAGATGGFHEERLREKLCQLARGHGKVGPDGIELELPLTHELLAQMVGSARETVTTALSRLRGEGFLVRAGGSYRLNVSPEALEADRLAPL
jgi:hypothetical protein